jgi:hypothetical protein
MFAWNNPILNSWDLLATLTVSLKSINIEPASPWLFRACLSSSIFQNLRRTLWMAGQVAILQSAKSYRDKFERYTPKDRQNTQLRCKAYTEIAAKMALNVHGIIKHGEPYSPLFEG